MPKVRLITRRLGEKGSSAVEVLLAATVFGLLVTALVGAMVYGRTSTASSGEHRRAMLIAEEGIEATRNIAADDYASLANGNFGLAQSGGQWTFSGASDISGIFTRHITIADAGASRKSVTATVTWPVQGGGTSSVTLVSRLTNWMQALPSWVNAVVGASADATGTTNAIKVDISGDYAYVVRSTTASNFVVVNISNPAAPSIASTITIAGTPTNIAVSGNYAYVTNTSDTAELQVVEVTTPTAPVLRASVNMTGTGNGLSVARSGNYAFVGRASDTTTSANEFTVVNVTNPLSPSVAGGYNNNLAMNGIYISGNYAYVATSSTSAEMLVINITTPTSPTLGVSYNVTGSVAAASINGFGTTVLLGQGTNLRALNVTTPTSPSLTGSFAAASTINSIEVNSTNQYAFLGTSSTTVEFQVVNIANLASMSQARAVDVTGTASTVSGLAYEATDDIVIGASASDTQEIIIFRKN